jgi:hypothetical protein
MSPSFTIDLPRRLVYVGYHDQPAFQEWAETMDNILHTPGFEDGFDFLLDRSAVTEAASPQYAEAVVRYLQTHQPLLARSRWAVVVQNDLNFGMTRMLHGLAGFIDTAAVFRDRQAAEEWLYRPARKGCL